MDRSTKFGAAFLCLFGLPFAAFGMFALVQAVHVMGTPTRQPVWMLGVFGLVFSGVGFGLMATSVVGARRLTRQKALEALRPTEPWLWREDWAQGRIQSKTRNDTIGAWIFAIFWNLVSAPTLILVPKAAAAKPAVYIALIFPVIGVFLLIRAIRQTIAYAEFGRTYFEMASVPGVIGGEISGTVQARFPHSPYHGILLRLTSVHRFRTGSGNSQSTTEQILWRDEHKLSSGQLCPGPIGTTFPVSFRIPWDAQATVKLNPRDEYVWLLEALADVPGVDYHDIFEVPVFRTSKTPATPEATVFAQSVAAPQAPERTTISVQQIGNGTEFYFSAARNKGTAISSTAFLAIFAAVSVFLWNTHAPRVFPIVFSLFVLLAFYSTLQQWLGTARVQIGEGALRVQAGLLGGGKWQSVPFANIADIRTKIQTQQGGATGTPFYDIELFRNDGKKLTLGRALREKDEAEWIVSEMRRLCSLNPKSMNAAAL